MVFNQLFQRVGQGSYFISRLRLIVRCCYVHPKSMRRYIGLAQCAIVSVLLSTIAMCIASGLLAVRKLLAADPANLF